MTVSMGSLITALIIDKNEQALYAQYQGITYRVITNEESHLNLGDTVEGLVYENQKEEKVLITKVPKALKNEYVSAPVIETKRGLGAFVDVGLPEKDILVSMDDMPYHPSLWPHLGDYLFVKGSFDAQGRLWGKMPNRDEWIRRTKFGNEKMHNNDVEGTVVLLQKAGTFILLDSGELAFIHPSERIEEPRLGQKITARVIGLRDDGVLYVSTMPRAYEIIEDDAAMIFETIKRMPDQKLPLTNKSTPEEIEQQFAISKGRFKRAIGHLLKENLIAQDESHTYLI
ncbi:hypothetical protein [Allofustis seminis]|uniref:hypothetical protein n=1 Tax=Allofustis seminis TaxID=166939 RepID=UPI00037947A7|nr:hypothetical protein [Allofustis seminis]